MSYSREDTVCEGQYSDWLRVTLPKGGKKWDNAESMVRKNTEQKSGLGNYNGR